MVMFDSLNRHMLPNYGCDWTYAPNFKRLAARCTTFDGSYVASMPCMPARRDLHTGRPNFLHCAWGPLELFDDSFVTRLRGAGVYTHLCSDHYHYWEDAGATYHARYDTWEFIRGQEGDPWIGQVADPEVPENINGKGRRQDWVNRPFMHHEKDQPMPQAFVAGVDFIERNHEQDNWFLQLECFDPHEPFFAPRKYHDLYPGKFDGPLFDWPGYRSVTESPEQIAQVRQSYAAILSMCDAHLGDLLDIMDKHNMWEDTMLIVWTDHGFMLSEHGCWAKNWMPLYEEVSHTPFFVYDPRFPEAAGQRRSALVQPALDLAPTLLSFYGQEKGPHMLGYDLAPVIEHEQEVRDAAIFGYFRERINVTDGRHVLYEVPKNLDVTLYEYTLLPARMRMGTAQEVLDAITLQPPMSWTAGYPTLKIPSKSSTSREADKTVRSLCFDLQADPGQMRPLDAPEIRAGLREHMARLMQETAAMPEQFERMGFAVCAES
jgi:arylsulfatase A-like enzyme